MREYTFESSLCAHLEATGDWLIARQLGASIHAPSNRILDVVLLEPGPEFARRAGITESAIPGHAIDAGVGPGRFRYWKRAFDHLDVHPEQAKRVIDRAVSIGFFEAERRNGRDYIRQTTRYPVEWFGRIVAIENKPDLGDPGALASQLRKDVTLGIADEVVLATGSYVTGAHLNRFPPEVGIWRFDPSSGVEEVRAPTPLSTRGYGLELLEEHPGRVDVHPVTPREKARCRRTIAERAYGKGWRPEEFPPCSKIEAVSVDGSPGLPFCRYKDRIVNPATCGRVCPGFDRAPPPAVDVGAIRDTRTPWVAAPDGIEREQVALDRFSDE